MLAQPERFVVQKAMATHMVVILFMMCPLRLKSDWVVEQGRANENTGAQAEQTTIPYQAAICRRMHLGAMGWQRFIIFVFL